MRGAHIHLASCISLMRLLAKAMTPWRLRQTRYCVLCSILTYGFAAAALVATVYLIDTFVKVLDLVLFSVSVSAHINYKHKLLYQLLAKTNGLVFLHMISL